MGIIHKTDEASKIVEYCAIAEPRSISTIADNKTASITKPDYRAGPAQKPDASRLA